MARGYVAVLDVLGFTQMVGRGDVSRIQTYLNTLDAAMHGEAVPTVEYLAYSDSVTLSTEGDGEDAFKSILSHTSALFYGLVQNSIPVRGAIAHGEYVRKAVRQSVFLAGEPIVEAHKFERQQDWVGISLCRSVVARSPQLSTLCLIDRSGSQPRPWFEALKERLPWATFVQHTEHIPFKETPTEAPQDFRGFSIVPTAGRVEPANIADEIKACIHKLDEMLVTAPTPSAQRKYRATMAWLFKVYNQWDEVKAVVNLITPRTDAPKAWNTYDLHGGET